MSKAKSRLHGHLSKSEEEEGGSTAPNYSPSREGGKAQGLVSGVEKMKNRLWLDERKKKKSLSGHQAERGAGARPRLSPGKEGWWQSINLEEKREAGPIS